MTHHNVFVSMPVARGVDPRVMWNIFEWRTELEKVGHRLHGSSTLHMMADLARSELATVFLSTTCDVNVLVDDDCQVSPTWIPKMVSAIDAGCDIISAPCLLRNHGGADAGTKTFNVLPTSEPVEMGGLRVVECAWTGLGAVMVSRQVMERLHASALEASAKPPCPTCGHKDRQTYQSVLMRERTSAAIYQSSVQPATRFLAGAPDDINIFLLDDRVFSFKAIELGFKIHAAIDVPTVHDGMPGCFSDEVEKLSRLQAREMGLVGADGKSIKAV
jgi:hypothetical protein